MGNTQPTNKTNKKVTQQKLENAKKLGILSLSEHNLEHVPDAVVAPELCKKLRTLDLSKNRLAALGPQFANLEELKTLHLDNNKLAAGSLTSLSSLIKLQSLSVAQNRLGNQQHSSSSGHPTATPTTRSEPLPPLPVSLRSLNVASNHFSSIPPVILSATLVKLEKLDLSYNQLATIPDDIANLANLQELQLDRNAIVSLPAAVGQLTKLKVLSLRHNKLHVHSTIWSNANVQPLPATLFTNTALIDLNLHGNDMTNTILNQFDGFAVFLERRQKVKNKTLTDLDVCGLK